MPPESAEKPITETTEKRSFFESAWVADLDDANEEVRPRLSRSAIWAFVLSVGTIFALANNILLLLAPISLFLAIGAYWSIGRSNRFLKGKLWADCAIVLSLSAFVSAFIADAYYKYTVSEQANQFCQLWFQAVKDKNARLVWEMDVPTWERGWEKSDAVWWSEKLLGKPETVRDNLERLNHPLLKTLGALGDQARITRVKTIEVKWSGDTDVAEIIYAVTYPGEKGEETFFLLVQATRVRDELNKKQWGWQMIGAPQLLKEKQLEQFAVLPQGYIS